MPELIKYLLEHPDNAEAIGNLQLAACSDGTTWSGGFAALPYMVDIARKLPPARRLDVLMGIGWIVTAATQESDDAHAKLEPYLAESYQQAIQDSLPLATEALQGDLPERETAALFFVVAALKGHIPLAGVLANLDSCEHCNEILGWS
jgi:hypothetical protein